MASSLASKISDYYPWNVETSLVGQLLLCLDDSLLSPHQHDGSFTLDSLLLKHCRLTTHRIVLIITSKSPIHYRSMLRKNIMDIAELVTSGRLECIQLVSDMTMEPSQTDGVVRCLTWQQLQSWQNTLFTAGSDSSQQSMVFIDDLDAFELLADSVPEARRWMQKLISNIQDVENDVTASMAGIELSVSEKSRLDSVVCYARRRGTDDTCHEDGQPRLSEYLVYQARTVVSANALKTGLSSAVHGTITVQYRDMRVQPLPVQTKQVLQYRALNDSVQCVAYS